MRCVLHPENHKHNDANPSMVIGTKTNKAYCHVCQEKALSNIDLVMTVRKVTAEVAVTWILEHWSVPRRVRQIKRKTAYPLLRHTEERAQVVEFEVEYKEAPTRNTVRNLFAHIWCSPVWRKQGASTVKGLLVLWQLASHHTPKGEPPFCIHKSQRELARIAGLERATLRKVLRVGESMGLLEYDSGFRSVHEDARRSAYVRFTPFSFRFLAMRQTYSRVKPKIASPPPR